MSSTQSICLIVFLSCLFVYVHAHTYLSSVTIDGQKQTGCVRPVESNSPVMPFDTNTAMKCGLGTKATQPAAQKCSIAAGGKVGLQYYHNAPSPTDDIIDASHRGPCLVYLSRDNGDTWFKIYENGYDQTTQKFCVDTLKANGGYYEFKLPTDIAPGDYLLRTELIALHEASRKLGAQPYVSCTELTISGGGKAKPAGVVFPGEYQADSPGMLFDLYNGITSYPIPGPALYQSGGSGGRGSSSGGGGGGGGDNNGSNSGGGGGLSAGGAAALAIFFIVLVAVVAGAAFFYKKKGHLFGHTFDRSAKGQQYLGSSRTAGNYVAFNDSSAEL